MFLNSQSKLLYKIGFFVCAAVVLVSQIALGNKTYTSKKLTNAFDAAKHEIAENGADGSTSAMHAFIQKYPSDLSVVLVNMYSEFDLPYKSDVKKAFATLKGRLVEPQDGKPMSYMGTFFMASPDGRAALNVQAVEDDLYRFKSAGDFARGMVEAGTMKAKHDAEIAGQYKAAKIDPKYIEILMNPAKKLFQTHPQF